MSADGAEQWPTCRECGSSFEIYTKKCWLCGAVLPPPASVPAATKRAPEPRKAIEMPILSTPKVVVAPPPPEAAPTVFVSSDPIPPARPAVVRGSATFTLSSLFLLVTLCAVFCGVTAEAPGLAVPLAVIILPAIFRTFVWSTKRKQRATPITTREKIYAFADSASLIFVALLMAGGVALISLFLAVMVFCSINSAGGGIYGLILGVLGLVAAVAVLIWMLKATWPR